MKLNNKGMAISGILYSILVLFIVLIFGVLSILASSKFSFDKFKNDIIKKLNSDVNLEPVKSEYKEDILNGAYPTLTGNMVPVTISDTGIIKMADINSEWYKYSENKWANAVVLRKDIYKSIGQVIKLEELEAMFVWIPRFEYSKMSEDIAKINFLNKSVVDPSFDKIIHPAFTFGDTELSGFWISKFEVSGQINNLKSLPANRILTNASISAFSAGITSMHNKFVGSESKHVFDTHLIKNIEWGAVALLNHSIYGQCDYTNYCFNQNSTLNNYLNGSYTSSTLDSKNSTTKNQYGVFDMAGSTYEFTMSSILDTANNNLLVGKDMTNNSGFNGLLSDGNMFSTGIDLPDYKYLSIYNNNISENDLSIYKIGDAINDISSHYFVKVKAPTTEFPWIVRGNTVSSYTDGFNSNVSIYDSQGSNGKAIPDTSTRIIITTN